MILIIDNYDSFTYNLVQYISEFDTDIIVKRNDKMTVDEIKSIHPDAILFSPGPGTPANAGHMEDIIQQLYQKYPMLGICLGHQAICEVFQADIHHAKKMLHGESSSILIRKKDPLFETLPDIIQAGRYHSLIVENLKEPLEITAVSMDHEIMAVQHQSYPVYGVQFHPESLLTPDGKTIISNFIRRAKSC